MRKHEYQADWDSDSVYLGSNPSLPANIKGLAKAGPLSFQAPNGAVAAILDAMNGFLAYGRRQLADMAAQHPESPAAPNWLAEMARIDRGASLRPAVPVIEHGRRRLSGRDLDIHLTTADCRAHRGAPGSFQGRE